MRIPGRINGQEHMSILFAGEKYDWLKSKGIKFFPVVGWAERGGSLAGGHGNSVPRFHIVWGTGPGIVKPFVDKVKQAMKEGFIDFKPRHRVDEFVQRREDYRN